MLPRILFVGGLALVLTACGTGTTTIMSPYAGPNLNYSTVTISHGEDLAEVPAEVSADFARAMSKEFFDEKVFAEGDDLQITYSFVQFEAGSQFQRWLWGGLGNSGEASLTVKVDFADPDGKQLSQINVTGRIGSGFFGGSISEALNKAAKEAADYAVATFK